MDIAYLTRIATDFAASQAGWSVPAYINAGASGAVFSLEHPVHGRVALKIYDPVFFTGDNALIEEDRLQLQARLAGLHHPHLIRTIETGPIASAGTWYLLMEFLPWRDLSEVIAGVPDAQVAPLIAQLASAVLFLKDNDLVHRDIKPANIAVSDDFAELKLLDLGVLRRISVEEGAGTDRNGKKPFIATAQYSPPEYLSRDEPRGEAGFDALNVYQIGAVLHDMIMKHPLFAAEAASGNKFVLFKAAAETPPKVFSAGVPARLLSLCRAALDKDPARRASAVTVADFARGADVAGDIRCRFGARRGLQTDRHPPSVLEWRDKVADWLAAAAAAEHDVLGAVEIRSSGAASPIGWTLRFTHASAVLPVRLEADGAAGVLRLTLGEVTAQRPALQISAAGPDIPADLIVPQLREQMLFALDELSPVPDGTEP